MAKFDLIERLGLEVFYATSNHVLGSYNCYAVNAAELEELLQKHITRYTPGTNGRVDDSITIWLKPRDERVSREEIAQLQEVALREKQIHSAIVLQLCEKLLKHGVRE